MKIHTHVVGPFQVNCHILINEETKQAIVFDPGDEGKKICSRIQNSNLDVQAIILTHGHIDHILAAGKVKEATGAPIMLHKEDLALYENAEQQGSFFGISTPEMPKIDEYLEDNQELSIAGFQLRVLHTPGHSPGSISIFIKDEEPAIIAGDTLFQGSIGRTDLWGGNFEVISQSIQNKLYSFDDATTVYCGHGPETTIGFEKKNNGFVTA